MSFRGDIKLQVRGKAIKLTPSFSNLMEIEDRLAPETVFSLLDKAKDGHLRGREVVTVLYCGTGTYDAEAMAWKSSYEFVPFGELCLGHNGIVGLLAPAIELLTSLMVSMTEDEPATDKPKKKPRTPRKKPAKKASVGKTSLK